MTDIIIVIMPCIMMPEQIMLIMTNRRKTDTAGAMPVLTALLNVKAELCAQNVEGAVPRASFEKQVFSDECVLSIAATSGKYIKYYIMLPPFCQAKIQIKFKKVQITAFYTLFPKNLCEFVEFPTIVM